MALIIWIPPDNEEEPITPLYPLVKTSLALAEADGNSTLESVQARSLVALFEIGHGLEDQAFVSLGALERAASMLQAVGGLDGEEGLSVWWAVVILDRYRQVHSLWPFCTLELMMFVFVI